MEARPLNILVADDNQSDRMILCAIVKKMGYTVCEAADGNEAIDQYLEQKPDIILLDVIMPNLNGQQAAKSIKTLAGEDMVPIIFLTSLQEASDLATCLESGGDDFISKPYNKIILKAKINAFSRMLKMHNTLQTQRDLIRENNEHMRHEQQVARAVYDNVAHSGCLDLPNIKHLLSPFSIFNGDVLLAARKPSGSIHILLGDFTGHGLPAAIGAMPLAEITMAYQDRAIHLVEVASGYRFQVVDAIASEIVVLFQDKAPKYSRAILETLALIAYRQPITRGEIEDVRGVAVSSHLIKTLLERDWIKEVGHKEVPGRPALLATTKEFLDYFSLKSLAQLPQLMPLSQSSLTSIETQSANTVSEENAQKRETET